MRKTLTLLPAVAAVFSISACADHSMTGPAVQAAPESVGASNASTSSGLRLHPDGFGPDSYAAWNAHEGLPDSHGNSDQALYFQKMTATETNAAAVATITGLEGQPLTALTGLQWEHRTDGWCGAGAPRWDIFVTGPGGFSNTIFLGCAAAAHTPDPSNPNWIIDTFPGLGAAVTAALPTGANPADFTISGLEIVFDEGTSEAGVPLGPGFVYLDNIKVNDQTWTSPADNGN
jgi:hypothetical protein